MRILVYLSVVSNKYVKVHVQTFLTMHCGFSDNLGFSHAVSKAFKNEILWFHLYLLKIKSYIYFVVDSIRCSSTPLSGNLRNQTVNLTKSNKIDSHEY